MSQLSRRAILSVTSAGVATTLASGCGRSTKNTGPEVDPDRFVSGSFRSRRMRGAQVGWSIAYPPGHRDGYALPVVITLHGRGATHRTAFESLHLDQVLDHVVGENLAPPFAVASVDGGDHGYWHRRVDGTDAGAMVADEFVPLLRRRDLGRQRIGLHGWSMGGYGALLLAGERRVPARVVAVASPALFTAAGNTPPGAFDDAEDYLRNDVYANPERLDGLPLRIDCGQSDPFFAATREFVGRLAGRPASSFGPGHHDAAYWRTVAPAELRFVGSHLH